MRVLIQQDMREDMRASLRGPPASVQYVCTVSSPRGSGI